MSKLTGLTKLTEQGGPLSPDVAFELLAVPDTTAAWAVVAELVRCARASLGSPAPDRSPSRPCRDDPSAVLRAEAAAARLFNASADAALALMSTGVPSPATRTMVAAVAKLISALAAEPLASNACLETTR